MVNKSTKLKASKSGKSIVAKVINGQSKSNASERKFGCPPADI